MRGRVFLVVAPRVFYLGGFFVSRERSQIFLFFSCKSRGDQYLRGTSIMSSVLVVRLAMCSLEAPRVFYLGGFFVSGEGIRFSCFSLAIEEEISILELFSFVKKYFSKPAGRETRKLLKSSLEFFSGGFFVLRRKCGFLDFVLLFGEESLPLE